VQVDKGVTVGRVVDLSDGRTLTQDREGQTICGIIGPANGQTLVQNRKGRTELRLGKLSAKWLPSAINGRSLEPFAMAAYG
jgi:hypothetical protein